MSSKTAPVEMGSCPACGLENVPLRAIEGVMVCEKCSMRRFSSKVRRSIQEAFQRQAEKKRKEAWAKRLDVARRGVKLYEEGKFPEALNVFEKYIQIVETRHNVGGGGLHPAHFDAKKDAAELLLISGVYWDMAKIYDRMKGHVSPMKASLNKFIEFSIGKPHVILASEALRKYIDSGSAIHVEDFRNAHEIVSKHLSRCFIATAVFGPEAPEVQLLRGFRDQVLLQTSLGRILVRLYYRTSPPIACRLAQHPALARMIEPLLRLAARIVGR